MNNVGENNDEEFEEVYSVVEILEEEDEIEKQDSPDNKKDVEKNEENVVDTPTENLQEEMSPEKKEDVFISQQQFLSSSENSLSPTASSSQTNEVDLLIRKAVNRRIYSGKRVKLPYNIVRPIQSTAPPIETSLPEKTCDVCKTKFINSHSCSIKLKKLSYCHFCDLKLDNSDLLIEHYNNVHRNGLQCLGCKKEFTVGTDFYIHVHQKLFGVKPEIEIVQKMDEESEPPNCNDNIIPMMTEDLIIKEDWSGLINGFVENFELPPAKKALIDLDLDDNRSLSNIQLDEAEFKDGMKVISFKIELDDDDYYQYECLQEN